MTSPEPTENRGPLLWWGLLAVVVVLGLVAVFASMGDSGTDLSEEVRSQQTSDVSVAPGPSDGDGSTAPDTSAEQAEADGPTAPGESSEQSASDQPAAAGSLPAYPEQGPDPAVGQVIPSISGSTLAGEPLTISADGKAKVILFVAHWCPHCQREIPVLTEHLRNNPMPDDVELLTVSTAVVEERGNYPPQKWLESAGWTAPVLADSEEGAAAFAYGLSSFPYYVVVDADGKVVVRTSGELTAEAFDSLVQAAQTASVPG